MAAVLALPDVTAASLDPARDELATSHLPLVVHIARELVGKLPAHIDRSELVSAGSLALVCAAQAWDPERGVPFHRYAAIRIRGALLDELRGSDWASRSVRTRARRIDETRQRLHCELVRRPTAAELAAAAGMSVADLVASEADVARASVLSLQVAETEDGGSSVASERPGPEEALLRREELGYLDDAIESLPERLRLVIRGYFFEQQPMAVLATQLGVTESRISQLRAEAVRLLRLGLTASLHPEAGVRETGVAPRTLAAREAYVATVAQRSTTVSRLRYTNVHGEPLSSRLLSA